MRSTATVVILQPTVAELCEHGSEMFAASWAEIRGTGALAVDWAQYHALEDAGLLITFGAWVDTSMVGYSVATVLPGMNTEALTGELLSMFVKPEFRRGGLGTRLIRLTENAAQTRGARLRWRVKQGQPLDRILPRLGYQLEDERVYTKKGVIP